MQNKEQNSATSLPASSTKKRNKTKRKTESKKISEFPSPSGEGSGVKGIKILTFTPCYQRPDILKIMLKGLKRLVNHNPKKYDIHPFFIVSESQIAQILLKEGYDFLFTPNKPVGEKKNNGLRYALENYDFDYILEIGSDDLIAGDYLDLVDMHLQKSTPQFHPEDVYFYDTRTGKTAYWNRNGIIGLGRFIHRRVLQKSINKRKIVWEPERNRGLDSSSWRQLKIVGYDSIRVPTHGKIYTLDLKSDVNINTIDHFSPADIPLQDLRARFPELKEIR